MKIYNLSKRGTGIVIDRAERELYTTTMTQYEIAKRLGISEAAVSKWYTGKSVPTGDHLIALSKLLDKDIGTLLKEFLKKRSKLK